MFLNIRNTQFDQSSPVQPNTEKKNQKIPFLFTNLKTLKIFLFSLKTKNAVILVLPIEKISLQPELSSPPRFRREGGYPERYGRTEDGGRRTEILLSNIGF